MRHILLTFGFLLPSIAYAECSFRTADYLSELVSPKSIRSINIEIPQSSKFARNQFKILTSKSNNIPNKLKKKFKAEVMVNYDFGDCTYTGRVRQSGDWKDHIGLVDGNPIQSLDVHLKNGNISGATRFKLLIPASRNARNEVLGTLLLRQLGFIAPETFEVRTNVNGVQSLMLFQEKTEKELLERNLRREGPIFEGDESLLWSYYGYSNFELEALALTRLVNDNWFQKGQSSQSIVVESHDRLQKAYLENSYLHHVEKQSLFLQANGPDDHLSDEYHLLLLAMGGEHALKPHNRKFYFNAIEDRFEPIYYDGNLSFQLFDLAAETPGEYSFNGASATRLLTKIKTLIASKNFEKEYAQRIISPKDDDFVLKSISQVIQNLETFNGLPPSDSRLSSPDHDVQLSWYKRVQKEKKLSQDIIGLIELRETEAGLYLDGNVKQSVSIAQLSGILSNNEFKSDRYVVIGRRDLLELDKGIKELTVGKNVIKMSGGISFNLEPRRKRISFRQDDGSDWVLFLGGDYSNWEISFEGVPYEKYVTQTGQRFNEFGLTGCLTLYQTIIDNTKVEVSNGQCEDSLNLLRVDGKNVTVKITDAFADALDADFSQLNISRLDIKNAGNDCFDVSGGAYSTQVAKLENCNDKAMSIGEMSTFNAAEVLIDGATIGISSKDFSEVTIKRVEARDLSVCGEAKQKKQEFGGGKLVLETVDCAGSFTADDESGIRMGG